MADVRELLLRLRPPCSDYHEWSDWFRDPAAERFFGRAVERTRYCLRCGVEQTQFGEGESDG